MAESCEDMVALSDETGAQEATSSIWNGFTVRTVKHPVGIPVMALDGEDLQAMLHAARANLGLHRDAINELNVFPVPDGDTGTNMLLTMQAACHEIANLSRPTVGTLLQRAAHGALMGARGNSGVILSQILRGMARVLDNKALCTASDLAEALHEGTDTAYKGVSKPVEGTILTVVRRASEAAGKAASIDQDLRFVLERVVYAAAEAVAETPSLLPILAKAGVVDAGGQGLYVILEGMLRCLRGEPIVAEERVEEEAQLAGFADEWGYDIQYLILGRDLDEEFIRRRLAELGGQSIVVGSGDGVIKVHVHSNDPGPILSLGASLGHLDDIVVENMTLQTLRRRSARSQAAPSAAASPVASPPAGGFPASALEEAIGVVAVVLGPGFQRLFESLGVSAIVPGGQTMNPSTQELLAAIERVPSQEILVLPNNSNVILAAQQAQALSRKRVRIVPSRTLPQGISALLAFNPQASLEENARNMEAALRTVETGEITIAVRDAEFDGIRVSAGDVIGLHNDVLSARGDSVADVMDQLLAQMHAAEAEVITIYYGQPVTRQEAEALADRVRAAYPNQEVELIDGGQPHYHYILSAE
ncbi:MAG: DAK2 domain-containing protein [Anaerolineae bacterium]|nr:DAK2 domain-containing protein [Anaerolineae bacterium]MDW8101065.1 DAK2 domain-containing protein [Anaerolineae bacterium]